MGIDDIYKALKGAGFSLQNSQHEPIAYIEFPCLNTTKQATIGNFVENKGKYTLKASYYSEGNNILSNLREEINENNLKEKCEKFKNDIDKAVKATYGYRHRITNQI